MARVITFSRVYPSYHPKAGQPTHFVEKLWNAHNAHTLDEEFFMPFEDDVWELNKSLPYETVQDFLKSLAIRWEIKPKMHTIRAGKRWKEGDRASFRVWSGKPYASKQIIIMPEVTICQVLDIEIDVMSNVYINGEKNQLSEFVDMLAENDGLTRTDLFHWFNKLPFSGQIIFQHNSPKSYSECLT